MFDDQYMESLRDRFVTEYCENLNAINKGIEYLNIFYNTRFKPENVNYAAQLFNNESQLTSNGISYTG